MTGSIIERFEIEEAKPRGRQDRTIEEIIPQDCKYKRFWCKAGLPIRMVVGHSGRYVIFDPDAMKDFPDCPGISVIREGEGDDRVADWAFYRTQEEINENLRNAERSDDEVA